LATLPGRVLKARGRPGRWSYKGLESLVIQAFRVRPPRLAADFADFMGESGLAGKDRGAT